MIKGKKESDFLLIKRRKCEYNFILSEIIKRHIEEYNKELFLDLENLKNKFINKYANISNDGEYIFISVVSSAIDLFRLHKFKISPAKSPLIEYLITKYRKIFNFDEHKKLYIEFDKIGNSYDLIPTEIIYPYCMADAIKKYYFNYPLFGERYSNLVNDNTILLDTGFGIYLISKNGLISEEDCDYIKYQFILNRINHNYKLSVLEREILKSRSNISYRLDSFFKYVSGLLIWDLLKSGISEWKVLSIYKQYYSFGKIQDTIDRQETIERSYRESKRLVSRCIKYRKILPSGDAGDFIPPTIVDSLNRYPVGYSGKIPPDSILIDIDPNNNLPAK